MTLGHKVEQLKSPTPLTKKGLFSSSNLTTSHAPTPQFCHILWLHKVRAFVVLTSQEKSSCSFSFWLPFVSHFKCRYGVDIGRFIMVAWIRVTSMISFPNTSTFLHLSRTGLQKRNSLGSSKANLDRTSANSALYRPKLFSQIFKIVTVHTNCNITLTPVDLKAWNLFEAFDYHLLLPDKVRFRLKKSQTYSKWKMATS